MPIVINPRPQPIPTWFQRPPYYINPRLPPQAVMANAVRRILASRRSVSHGQSGIEQIGTGNNILQGNVQQIQLGSRKPKRRGMFCDDCLKFSPSQSNLFGSSKNIATSLTSLGESKGSA